MPNMDLTLTARYATRHAARQCFDRVIATGIASHEWVLVTEPDENSSGMWEVIVRVVVAEPAAKALAAIFEEAGR